MGKWLNKKIEKNSVSKVVEGIDNFLNTLEGTQAASAKTVMANQSSKDPFGGVFYYDGETGPVPVSATSWKSQTVEGSDRQRLLDDATLILNTLPLDEALVTKMAMSDKQGKPPTLALFHPTSTEE